MRSKATTLPICVFPHSATKSPLILKHSPTASSAFTASRERAIWRLEKVVCRSSQVSCHAWAPLRAPSLAGARLPDAIAVTGDTLVVTLHAVGAQIYDCKVDPDGKLAWQFREPIAALLMNDKTVGRHYAGPSWDLADGSRIVGWGRKCAGHDTQGHSMAEA